MASVSRTPPTIPAGPGAGVRGRGSGRVGLHGALELGGGPRQVDASPPRQLHRAAQPRGGERGDPEPVGRPPCSGRRRCPARRPRGRAPRPSRRPRPPAAARNRPRGRPRGSPRAGRSPRGTSPAAWSAARGSASTGAGVGGGSDSAEMTTSSSTNSGSVSTPGSSSARESTSSARSRAPAASSSCRSREPLSVMTIATPGCSSVVLADDLRHEAGAEARRGPEPDPTAPQVVQFPQRAPGVVGLGEHAAGDGQQLPSGRCELDVPGGPDEQRAAEAALQRADLLRERGLRDLHQVGGVGEVAGVGHGDEVGQLLELHTAKDSCYLSAWKGIICFHSGRLAF